MGWRVGRLRLSGRYGGRIIVQRLGACVQKADRYQLEALNMQLNHVEAVLQLVGESQLKLSTEHVQGSLAHEAQVLLRGAAGFALGGVRFVGCRRRTYWARCTSSRSRRPNSRAARTRPLARRTSRRFLGARRTRRALGRSTCSQSRCVASAYRGPT